MDEIREDREARMHQLKQQIARGEYEIDDAKVADAIVQRLREWGVISEPEPPAHTECSNPDRSPQKPSRMRSTGPSRTRPTHVRRQPVAVLSSLAALAWRPPATHSS
jgi:hypothetical protein